MFVNIWMIFSNMFIGRFKLVVIITLSKLTERYSSTEPAHVECVWILIPAGTAIRFEPGGERKVPLTEICPTRNSILFTSHVNSFLFFPLYFLFYNCCLVCSQAGLNKDYGTKKRKCAVRDCSSLSKAQMILNNATPKIEG